jgi:hypothetical protein
VPAALHQSQRPDQGEILGTILCGVLSGHRRYAHISGMRGDPVLPKLLGIGKLRSEDSIRRAFAHQDEEALTLWMDQQTDKTFAALLELEWVLDLDATVKTLYGRQEEAPVAPKKSTLAYANENRPWELYQTVFQHTLVKCQELVSRQGARKKFRFKNKLMSLDGNIMTCR